MFCRIDELARGSTRFSNLGPQANYIFLKQYPKQLFMACYLAIVPLSIPTRAQYLYQHSNTICFLTMKYLVELVHAFSQC
jgi:hypothetical protein